MTSIGSDRLGFGSGALLHGLARNWGLIVLRGVCAIAFAVAAIAWPHITLVALALLWGVYAFADGALSLAAAITGGTSAPRWWLAVVGTIGVLAGAFAFVAPGAVVAALLLVIAAWAIAIGVMQVIGAIRLRKEIDNEWMLGLSGVVSVLFGILLLTSPGAGALGLLGLIALYSVIFGVVSIMLGLRLRKHAVRQI